MNRYIWQNKKPRLSFHLMNKHPLRGGLGLPNLQAYHFAVTLDQCKFWWHNSSDKAWSQMEADILGISDWRAVMLDPLPDPKFASRLPPPVAAALHYWKWTFQEKYLQSGSSHTSIPLRFLPLHIPNLHLEPWLQKGILSLEDLYDGSNIRLFDDLQEKFGLLETDRFKYRQITHLLRQISSKQRAVPSSVFSFLSLTNPFKSKGSKVFYNLYTGNDYFTKTNSILKWEEKLGQKFSPVQWQTAIAWAHKSSSCANHWEQFQKLLSRWYFTPLRLARAYPLTSP